ncbi:non-ribosomal peptide synthetase [Brenneria corticis]|uniref:Carrier domain-containing protein n=1 Tax=Brenneria corticis TaxID=2173106 RepID=A0A2U1TXD0_9GAMM|nr:non-ribosomal peptide synthetase [Brenneria sp. CFCC 11842]PWC14049.1 hypothetical protein DDT56_14155 [Brenneria sp. CFCC 11842]
MNNFDMDQMSIAELEQLRARAKNKGIRSLVRKEDGITKVSRAGDLPVSFAQKSQWYIDQLPNVGSGSNIILASRISGELNVAVWQRSLDRILARHEGLRTVFVQREGRLHGRLLPADTAMPMRFTDLSERHDAQRCLADIVSDNELKAFELSQGPLIRSHLIRLDVHEHVFLLTLHHIICDGWSLGVLTQELNVLYQANLRGTIDELPALPVQYADYAHWQNGLLQGDLLVKQQAFWSEYLADIPVLLSLPWDRPRPQVQDFRAGNVSFVLDGELERSLRAYCRQQGCTVFMLLIAVWGALLSRLSGQGAVVIGTPTAGRGRPEFEPLIGLFMNMLAIRLDFSADPTLRNLLSNARQNILSAYDHQDLPFEKVVETLKPERSLDHTPIYQTIFSLRTDSGSDRKLELPGLTIENISVSKSYHKSDLELHCTESPGEISGVISYTRALFDEATAERYKDYLIALLRGLLAYPEQTLSEVDLISAKERDWLLYDLNCTEQSFDKQRFFFQQFEEQAAQHPETVAVVYGNQRLSYARLNHYANQLAHALIREGVVPEARVALCVERSPFVPIGLLAILKAGGVYVPMDAAYPSERLNRILQDAAPFLVLVDAIGEAVLNPALLALNKVWALDLNAWAYGGESESNPRPDALSPEHLAYIIYTSGSTGKPKGVMIEHHSLTNFTMQHGQRYGATVDSRVLLFSSFSFDASIAELTLGLAQGAALYLPTPEQRTVSDAFVDFLVDNQITHVTLVPTIVSAMIESTRFIEAVRGIKISLAGEGPSAELVRQLAKNNLVINEYGPTECTVFATCWKYDAEIGAGLISLGKPLANTQIYILDRRQQPVPRGVVGEIYIGGEGVARGYFQREDLTRMAFLPDPFTGLQDGRHIYRTGDLGYHLATGEIVYCGRNDNQVKIRGFRIELGEIESQLLKHPQISMCAVIASAKPGQEKRLLAYVVAGGDERVSSLSLREYLTERLPGYMIPAAFVQLEKLPFNNNGKLDRKALPVLKDTAYASEVYEAPAGDIEIKLMTLWQKLLGVEKISRHDNFYAQGGNSLLAMQLASEAGKLGINLPLMKIIQCPVLSKMASEGVDGKSALDEALPARQTGHQLPIFFLPAGSGNIEYFYELAPSIDPDYPVYGLPWLPADVEQEPTLEAMAHRMLKMIKQVQPEGPYHFVGYCSGGVIIHALTKLLMGLNEEVDYIGLIDALWIKSHPYALSEARQLFSQIEAQANRLDLDGDRYDELRALEDRLSMKELMRLGKQWQLIPEHVDIPKHLKIVQQQVNFARLVADYYPEPLDIDVYQFNATEELALKKIRCKSEPMIAKPALSEQLGWECALPIERIHIKNVPGDHNSMVANEDHRRRLGKMISQSIRIAKGRRKAKAEFDPLIPFVTHPGKVFPLICLPGAGSSVTSLGHFVGALQPGRSVYGLQPRGIESNYPPHSSIQTAATDNLKAIQGISACGPIHLLGHSHGGLVALEMARQLNLQGGDVASVTLVDSQAPCLLKDAWQLTNQQAMDDFAEAIFNTLNIRPARIDLQIRNGDVLTVLSRLHQVLKEHGRVPANSPAELLAGSFHAYLAARRWTYESLPAYPQNLHLVLASDPSERGYGAPRAPVDLALAWQKEIAGLQPWKTPGNHYSILSEQHAPELAGWWTRQVAEVANGR